MFNKRSVSVIILIVLLVSALTMLLPMKTQATDELEATLNAKLSQFVFSNSPVQVEVEECQLSISVDYAALNQCTSDANVKVLQTEIYFPEIRAISILNGASGSLLTLDFKEDVARRLAGAGKDLRETYASIRSGAISNDDRTGGVVDLATKQFLTRLEEIKIRYRNVFHLCGGALSFEFRESVGHSFILKPGSPDSLQTDLKNYALLCETRSH